MDKMFSNQTVIITLLLTLFSLVHLSVCETYCIVSEAEASSNQSCVTLNHFAMSDYYLNSEIVLMLQPGNHFLNVSISIFNCSSFTIASENSNNTRIICESQVKFIAQNVGLVYITGSHFVGCGANMFSVVDNISIESSAFTENHLALVLSKTSAVISNTMFLRNKYINEGHGSSITSNLAHITILGCSFLNNSGSICAIQSTVIVRKCNLSDNKGTVIFAYKGTIIINESLFYHNVPINHSTLVTVVYGKEVIIEMTNFTANSEVILTLFTSITISQCRFSYNYVPENAGASNFLPEVSYGGIVLAHTSLVSLTSCSFVANKATAYGGIVVMNNVTFVSYEQLELYHNEALEGTVVLINSNATFLGNTEFKNNMGSLGALVSTLVFRGNVSFVNNTPSSNDLDLYRGGAITLYFSTVLFSNGNAILCNNNAIDGGAFYAIGSGIYLNSIMEITSNSAEEAGGGIFLYQSPLYIHSNVSIGSNVARIGGGIYVLSSFITVRSSTESTFHNLTVTKNRAQMGGGLYFSSSANIYIYHLDQRPHKVTVILTSNVADEYGGSIYFRDDANTVDCEVATFSILSPERPISECFFQVVDLYRQAGTLGFYFESNEAYISGSVLFGGLLDRCSLARIVSLSFFDSDLGVDLLELDGVNYLKNSSNLNSIDSITSDAVSVCICSEGKPNCSLNNLTISSQKGRMFTVSVAALDQVGHLLNATIFVELPSGTGGLGDGQQSQTIADQCTDLSLSVTSKASSETIVIYAQGPCGSAMPSISELNLVFSECECPIGFEVDSQSLSTCVCVCSESLRNYAQDCIIETQSFVKSENVWIGYENNTNSVGLIISPICPYDYCVQFDSLEIDLNIPRGANIQCSNNRVGILCGSCQQPYSLSYGQSGCVKCDNLWPLYTALIIIAIAVLGILLVVAILFLNLTVTVATINGFIFSANILKALYPFSGAYRGIYIISFLNLDFGLNICFYQGFDTYVKTWLELVVPAYLLFIVGMVFMASNYSSKFSRFIGKRNPVETLATLIFLSYSKILQFVIISLSITYIKHENSTEIELVWLADGSIDYFGTQHTCMVIVAIAILLIVSIYTFLLLFWQFLVKLPRWKIFTLFRNTKVQTFIEMYHVPFHIRHRYWTGLLLLIRIVVYLVAAWRTTSDTRGGLHLTIISLLSLLLFIKSLYARVYTKWPVDVLESVLITLTIVITGIDWYILNIRSSNTPKALLAVTSTASIIILCLLAGAIVYHIKRYVIKKKFSVQKQLNGLSLTIRQRFQSLSSDTQSNNQEEHLEEFDNNFLYPANLQYLNVDRFGSILRVMESATESDYHALHIQELQDQTATEDSEDENVREPRPPTVSSI